MSRLDSVIRRLSAQRDCLNLACSHVKSGAFLDIGLGNGRTYHHLREIAPDREIWVIDRAMKAHPSSAPDSAFFLEGEADAMLKALFDRIGQSLALVHYDLGVGVPAEDGPLRDSLAPLIKRLMPPGALLVANGLFDGFEALPIPDTVAKGRYYILRA